MRSRTHLVHAEISLGAAAAAGKPQYSSQNLEKLMDAGGAFADGFSPSGLIASKCCR